MLALDLLWVHLAYDLGLDIVLESVPLDCQLVEVLVRSHLFLEDVELTEVKQRLND